MEESILLGTKPLVDSIRHFIRDPSGVFSLCHLCECRIVQWRHDSRLLLLLYFSESFKNSQNYLKTDFKVFRNFPKISEDFRTLPKISEDFPKIFKNPKTHKKRFLNIYEAFVG